MKKKDWDLKSIVTISVTAVMCVAFLITLIFALIGKIEPTSGVVMCVIQAFISGYNAIYAFYFSKKKDDKKEGEA